jgi:starch-binding outer membrane protein SusE/F
MTVIKINILNETIMKHIKSILYLLLVGIFLLACDKEENKVTFLGGTPPVLSSSSTSDLVLLKSNENFSSLQFQWTNPSYEFSNGVNTQDVSYLLQIDTTGSNFSNPKKTERAFTKNVSTSFTVKELNTALSGLELKDFVPHNFEFRIKATLASGSAVQYSNVVKIKITTYLDVVYPVPAKLFITGAATPADWQSGSGSEPVPLGQEFTKVNAYLFVINSLQLKASKGFLLLPVYSSWAAKYGFTGEKEKNNTTSDTFKPDGNDFISPPSAKAYKITVNFKTGKISFE